VNTKCPECGERAYVGFNSIECPNPQCKHFTITEETICPCCGEKGHFKTSGCKKKLDYESESVFGDQGPAENDLDLID
jgi:rRNA maturation protein Nop10